MSGKQLARGSSKALFSVFLLVSSTYSFSMEQDEPNVSSHTDSVEGVKYVDIDEVWKKAPVTVKNWAEELKEQKGDFKSLPYRLYLHGVSGVGKTTMGLGIWKENTDWDLKMISAGDLITKHRGGAARKLRRRFEKIDPNQKTVLIIDEAHVLMERSSQESTDTSETTETLKCFLDKQAEKRNMMVVLTGNHVKDMKESMKCRLFRSGVEILPPSPDELHDMFHYYAGSEELNHEDIEARDLLQIYKIGNIKVGRDIKLFAGLVKELIRDDGYRGSLKEYRLRKSFLLEVAGIFKRKAENFGIGQESLSDREFQQKLHDDAKWHSTKMTGAAIFAAPAVSHGVKYGVQKLVKEYDKKTSNKKNDDKKTSEDKTSEDTNRQASSESERSSFGSRIERAAKAVGGGIAAVGGGIVTAGGVVVAKAASTAGGIAALKTAVVTKAPVAAAAAAANPVVAVGIGVAVVVVGVGGALYYIFSEDEASDTSEKSNESKKEQ